MTEIKQTKEATEFEKKLREIIEKTLSQGQLMIVGTKQTGKTNSAMWLMRNMMQMQSHQEHQIKSIVYDLPMIWRFRYDGIPYLDHSTVRHLPIIQDLIIDLPYTDTNRTRDAIAEILMEEFIKMRQLKEKFEGYIPFTSMHVIEEAQNCFGTHSLSGHMGRFLLKIVSECANYNMVLITIGQRLADISTRIIERSRYYLIGNLSGDNDIKKIKRISNNQIAEKVKTLKRGEFIFLDREHAEYVDLIYFPKFEQTSKPYPYKDDNGNGKGYVRRVFLSS